MWWVDDTVLILALFWVLCAGASALIALNRAKNSLLWFGIGCLLGPIAFIAAAWPKRREKPPNAPPR